MTQTSKTSVSQEIYRYTGSKISSLQTQFLSGVPSARAKLAQFRHAFSAPAGTSMEVLSEVLEGLPESLQGKSDHLSAPEHAVYTALLLYSLHQQSKAQPMHVSRSADNHSVGFGAAIRRLEYLKGGGDNSGSKSPTRRRFDAIATSKDFEETTYHLRGIIRQLRDQNIPLDYAALATDLFLLQSPNYANGVRTRWFRDFYRTLVETEQATS